MTCTITTKWYLYSLILLFFLSSCVGNIKWDRKMAQADSIMELDNDSAMIAIKMLDAIRPQLSELTHSQKMRYELLYHKAMNKAGIAFTSDSMMLRVVDYYEHEGSSNERMLTYYVMGCVYRDLHEAPMALEYYNRATEQADTASADCDYATLCRVYGQMGELFCNEYLPHQELMAYDRATKYAYLAKDTLNAIRYYYSKSSAYHYLNKIDSAIIVNNHAARLFLEHGYDYDAKIAFGCNYGYYIEQKDSVNARKAFEAYQSTGYDGNSNYEDSKSFVLYEKGLFYLFFTQLDSAYYYLHKSLAICKSFNTRAAIAKALSQYYKKVGNDRLSAKYAFQYSEYNDSDLVKVRNTQLSQMQAMFDYHRNHELAQKAERKAERRMNAIYMIVMIVIVSIAIFLVIYRIKEKKKKQKMAATQKLYGASLLTIQNLKEELANLQNMNQSKVSAFIREKEDEIAKLQSEVKRYESFQLANNLVKVDRLLEESLIYKKFIYLTCHPKEQPSEDDWQSLRQTIENMIPIFVTINKKLNEKERKICLLVRLHIKPSVIGALVQVTQSYISLSRSRMLKKVCNREGTAKEFDEYIQNLF